MADFSLRIDPNVDPAEDAYWKIVPGLIAGDGNVSFESMYKPGYYITDNNFLAKLELSDGSDRFKAAATFKRVPGLAESTAISYQSYMSPDRFIRHSNFVLRIDPISTPSAKRTPPFRKCLFPAERLRKAMRASSIPEGCLKGPIWSG